MPKYSQNRNERIADQIQRDIVDILRKKVKDPRVAWININEVIVNHDHSVATIYWSVMPDGNKDGVAKALASAKGFIRSELSSGFKTYTIPQIKFIFDDSLNRAERILSLLSQVNVDASSDELDDTKTNS